MPEGLDTDRHVAHTTADANVRVSALEERQKLRDVHVDKRFDAMGAEFSSLDLRVSAQIAGLDQKIGLGFKTLTDELKADRKYEEARIGKIYDDIRADKISESRRPAAVPASMILSIIGVMFPTLSAAGVVILLVVNPIRSDIDEHRASDKLHGDGERRLALIDERTTQNRSHTDALTAQAEQDSVNRHNDQAADITAHGAQIAALQAQRVVDAERWGRLNTMDTWLRADIESIQRKAEDIDNKGSRYHNESATRTLERMRDLEQRMRD